MTHRIRQLARLLISLHCAAWIAALPVVPELHQTLADHEHVYCLEHGRFEDAGPRLPVVERVAEPSKPSGFASVGTPGREPPRHAERLACDLSNSSGHKARQQVLRTVVPFALCEMALARLPESPELPQSRKILDSAPKHSPPEQIC